jgi:hypothetical protein
MPSRQNKLKEIINSRYETVNMQPVCEVLIDSQFDAELQRAYMALGGVQEHYPIGAGAYDVYTIDFAVELDEERHFNRNRTITLCSGIYDQLLNFPNPGYKNFCDDYEQHCLRAAGWGCNWANHSTNSQFGKANSERNLEGNGSSRWKQRAFYDLLKDTLQLVTQIPLARISIYDEVVIDDGVYSINEILSSENYMEFSEDVVRLIISRL